MYELPDSLRLSSTLPFVGRDGELERLRALLPTAQGEGPRVVLVGGEPGSGKSRLVREFAQEAARDGALVLYGACDAVVRTPYGPFVDALDGLARSIDADELRTAMGASGGELTRLLPDLPARVGELPSPVEADPDTERHRLHTAVAGLLASVSRHRPVMLVLEDEHWSDGPTLLLLRHLARAGGNARLLLLATFRDTQADLPESLNETLADLRRSEQVVRLQLAGLSGAEVTEFVRHASEGEPEFDVAETAAGISDLTAGNPFLVCELWRSLTDGGGAGVSGNAISPAGPFEDLGSPRSVREVVSQRLSRVAPRTEDLLELVATAGTEFELEIIRAAAGFSEPDLLASFDEAVRSGMIEELPSVGLRYRFTHELVRRALYDRLTALRRAELHLRVGEALEAAEARSGRALADLAYHFAAAAPFGPPERAVHYNVLAAGAAIDTLDFDEAADRLRTAIELGIDDPTDRAEAWLDLGLASHRAGKSPDALQAFRAAADIARELGDAGLLARAAVGFEDACWRPGIADQGAVALLEEAEAMLGEDAQGQRVRLLAGLARALDFQGDHERAAVVRTEAVAMARNLKDRTGLAMVLMRAYWSRGISSMDQILEMLTEAKDLGGQLGNTEIRAEAMAWRVPAFVALADIGSARKEAVELLEMAERTAQPFMLHVATHYGSAIALCDGRFQEAEELASRSQEWSGLLTGRDASGVHGIQMFSLRREQGRLAELAPVIRILAGGSVRDGLWGPGLVSLLVELGMEDEARRALARLVADGLDPFRESLWLASLTYLTDACVALEETAVAELVYPELEPLAGANVMIGHLVACYGAADRYLGMLAATLGEVDAATAHFERAIDLNREMGASTWLAHTAYEYGRLLIATGSGDHERVAALLGEATGLAERIGMPALRARIDGLGAHGGAAPPDDLSPREAQILRLVARGLSNRAIGEQLFISEHTAANHVRSILRKTGCSNRTEAASYAHRRGLAEG